MDRTGYHAYRNFLQLSVHTVSPIYTPTHTHTHTHTLTHTITRSCSSVSPYAPEECGMAGEATWGGGREKRWEGGGGREKSEVRRE